ncbi:MAG: THUMP domain-containing class I SAM-dependent RNA methyltransferase, partial [Flammeovirgaceae bacterium]
METTYIAKTLFGLEEVLEQELQDLGAKNLVRHNRAVNFDGDMEMMYKANLRLRTAVRILKPIHTFEAKNEQELYDGIKEINWNQYIMTEGKFAIDSVVNSSYFNHSRYVALKSKDAIVDQFRDAFGIRPSVHVSEPDVRINIHVYEHEVTVSLDSSGETLHKRGYRLEKNVAPLNEVLAAGLILLSGWDKKSNFVDFMCGSGTIIIEAALYACNIAPGKLRKEFGFM